MCLIIRKNQEFLYLGVKAELQHLHLSQSFSIVLHLFLTSGYSNFRC